MKPIIPIYIGIILMLCFSHGSAQSLEEKVKHADLVIEGDVIDAKGFKTPKGIYTSATIKILKLFKGNTPDTTIEIVYEFGQADGIDYHPSDGSFFAVGSGEEGVFILDSNRTGNQLRTGLSSYFPPYGLASLIGYSGNTAKGLEKGLFAQIEAITGQKRTVFGLNEFERPSKFSLEAKVENSDVIIEGLVISRQGFHVDTVIRKGRITSYGSVIIKVSKVFKGEIKDSLIELVYLDGGSDEAFRDSYGFGVIDKEEGIFFLTKNKTNISQDKTLNSFIPSYGRNSFARYKWADPFNKSYIAVCFKTTYHDVEKDLFQKIEFLTGKKRTIFANNTFEH